MSNLALTRECYDALGRWDLGAVLSAFDPAIEWREAEGNPAQLDGSAWTGPAMVRAKLFDRIAVGWDEFQVVPLTFHDAGDTVVVEGRYRGKVRASGEAVDAQFCHVWGLCDGKMMSFQQYVDTAQLQRAVSGQ